MVVTGQAQGGGRYRPLNELRLERILALRRLKAAFISPHESYKFCVAENMSHHTAKQHKPLHHYMSNGVTSKTLVHKGYTLGCLKKNNFFEKYRCSGLIWFS